MVRWRHRYRLLWEGKSKVSWKIAQGKKAWGSRGLWDARRRQWISESRLAFPVRHPEHPDLPLWLVVARRKGSTPWYLLSAPFKLVRRWLLCYAAHRSGRRLRATSAFNVLHVCGITGDGEIWHILSQPHPDGTWSWQSFFGDIKGQAGNPGTFIDVSCTGVNG